MTTTQKETQISMSGETLQYYRTRKILGGMIMWKEKVFTDELGVDLDIATVHDIRDVYVNGELYQKVVK